MTELRVLLLIAVVSACGGDDPAEPTGPPLSELTLFPDRRAAIVGETITLTVSARDLSGAAVNGVVPSFTSSNSGVVLIEPSGRIVTRGVGTAVLRGAAGGKTAEATVYVGAASYDLAMLGPPRIVTASYIDLSKIERISRFRSTVGHSYTDGSETCRSMKHYFQPRSSLRRRLPNRAHASYP